MLIKDIKPGVILKYKDPFSGIESYVLILVFSEEKFEILELSPESKSRIHKVYFSKTPTIRYFFKHFYRSGFKSKQDFFDLWINKTTLISK